MTIFTKFFRNKFIATPEAGASARNRRRTWIGLVLSLAVHACLLFVAIQHLPENQDVAIQAEPGPIEVRLSRPAPPQAAAKPAEREVKPAPPIRPTPRPVQRRSPVLALPKPMPQSPPVAVAPPEPLAPTPPPQPVPPPQAQTSEPPDMTSMLNAARERRRAAQEASGYESPDGQPAGRTPGSNDIAMANINRSLQAARGKSGTNGVFQVLSKGVRMGQFSFRGWSSDARENWRQVIDVDAGSGGDVERAIVRKMIALIRSHFSGDFNWDSRRLGRVVVLSARPIDNQGLEDFLMREFFSNDS